MTTEQFKKDLAFSEEAGHAPFWAAVYKKAFPNMVSTMEGQGDFQSQRMGIDRVVLLSNGQTIKIDEKKRRKDYGDFCLEYLSNDRTKALGWMEKDLAIDYLAYAFMPSARCYLLPWPMLRRAWLHYRNDWMRMYQPHVKAGNPGYDTWSVPVPIKVVLQKVRSAMIIEVKGYS